MCQALKIHKISDLINGYTLSLLKSHFNNNSISRKFYSFLLRRHSFGDMIGHNDLISRCKNICQNNGISMWKFVFDDKYTNICKNQLKYFSKCDGVVDSIHYLLQNYNGVNRQMVQMLLLPF